MIDRFCVVVTEIFLKTLFLINDFKGNTGFGYVLALRARDPFWSATRTRPLARPDFFLSIRRVHGFYLQPIKFDWKSEENREFQV